MEYSKGKWKSRGNVVFIGDSYKPVCTVSVQKNYEDITFKPIEDKEQIANSKLICAAPEMLDFLIKAKGILNLLRHSMKEEDEKLDLLHRECGKLIEIATK